MDRRNKFHHLSAIILLAFSWISAPTTQSAEDVPQNQKPWQCTLRLLDPDGKPVSGGKVTAYQKTKEWTAGTPAWEIFAPVDPNEFVSDKNGHVTVSYPEPPAKALYLEVKAKGFVPLRYAFGEGEWSVDGSEIGEIPREFDVHLSPGVPAGGVVRGPDGRPVEGAVVVVLARGGLSETAGSPEPLDTFFLVLKTDAAGKWACRVPPPDEELMKMLPSGLSERQVAEMLQELNGEFDIDDVPVTVTVFHSDHAPKKTRCLPEGFFRSFKPHQELLRAFEKAGFVAGTTFDVVLENGVDLTGRVVDESGKPLEDTCILLRAETDMLPRVVTTETGEDGRFVVRHLLEEPSILFASRDGFAPCIQTMEVGAEPLRLVMKKGRQVKLTVRDSSGKAVRAAVTVSIDEGQFLDLPLGLPAKTDAEGNWTWNCAPVKPCSYTISADGFDTVLRELPPGEHAITLKRPGFVVGCVIDAETKTPIKRFFVSRKKVIENDYFTLSDSDWKNLFVADTPDGVFRCVCPEGPKFHVTRTFTVDSGDGSETVELPEPKYLGVIFRIEAEGYLPATTKTLPWREEDVEVTLEMKKAAPITGRIVDTKGRPVAGAEIVVVGEDLPAICLDTFEHNGFDRTDWPSQDDFLNEEADRHGIVLSSDTYGAGEAIPKQPRHTRSDKDGVFTLFPQKAPYELVVVHKDGIACVDSEDLKSSRDIVLNKWASIEGVVLVDGKPLPNTEIDIDPSPSPSTITANFGFRSGTNPLVQTPATFSLDGAFSFSSTTANTDSDGRFKVDRLPPSSVEISRVVRTGNSTSWVKLKTLTLAPGEIKKVRLDGNIKEEEEEE